MDTGAQARRIRMGQVLGQMGRLSSHDVDEILAEQRTTGARFGEVALALGLVQPEHVWAAWCTQLADNLEHVNLDEVGIDAQAIDCLPRDVAFALGVLPLRLWENQLIVAVTDPAHANATQSDLREHTGLCIRCVLADPLQLAKALSTYYDCVSSS
jgi:hypothetical protein